jgi:hypothetical protein
VKKGVCSGFCEHVKEGVCSGFCEHMKEGVCSGFCEHVKEGVCSGVLWICVTGWCPKPVCCVVAKQLLEAVGVTNCPCMALPMAVEPTEIVGIFEVPYLGWH